MIEKDFHESSKKFKRIFRILEILVVVAVIANLSFLVWFMNNQIWDPLGTYPIQVVTNSVESSIDSNGRSVTSPTIKVPADINAFWPTVNVNATKCSNEEVKVKGESYWRQIEPPGFTYANPPGVATRTNGCQSFIFRNEIPMDVRRRISYLASEGVNKTTWQIGGAETPISDSGDIGGIRLYQTQNFTVVYGQ